MYMKNNMIKLTDTFKELIKDEKMINEANPLGQVARSGQIVAKEIEPAFKLLKQDRAIAKLLKQINVKSVDEFLEVIKNDFVSIDKASTKVPKLVQSDARLLRGQFELSILKAPGGVSAKLLDIAAENLVKDARFIQKYKAVGNDSDLIKILEKNGYSNQAAKKIADKRRLALGGKLKPNPNPKPTPNPVPPVYKKWWTKIIEFLKKKKSWKQILAWGLGVGIPATILYNMVSSSGEEIPEDFPPTPPKENWPQCVQDLINNKKGQIQTSDDGSEIIFVNTDATTYPKGLQFYSNGRVKNVDTGKMGKWKCKGSNVAPETVDEATVPSNEISINVMDNYVDTAVDDLDGFVNTGNLQSLMNIVTALKGKKFEGKDALQEFLALYKEDEGGDDFISDVQSVGVKTLGTKAILLKRKLIAALSGQSSDETTTTADDSKGLEGIDITWDGESNDNDTPKPPKTSIYRDCQDVFPIGYGCRKMERIKEVQACLGLESKYQTGNFGPITRSKIESSGYIVSKDGLTQETYNKIMEKCKTNPSPSKDEPKIKPINPVKAEIPKVERPSVSTGDREIKPMNIQSTLTPNQYYDALVANGNIIGNSTDVTLDDGTVLPKTYRIKYKGEILNDEQVKMLDQVMSKLGYSRIKQKLKNRYGIKYVWQKQ